MHLQIPDPYDGRLTDRWLSGYAKRRRLAKRIVSTPGAYSAVSLAAKLLRYLARLNALVHMVRRDANQELSIRNAAQDTGGNPVSYGSGYGYENEETDFGYQKEVLHDLSRGARSKHWPILLEGLTELDRLIEKLELKRVVNFGVALAHIDDQLAQKYSDVDFIGIDRAPSVKAFNEKQYERPNMTFLAADIMDWVDGQESLEGALFVNMRTIMQLPERFVREYYGRLYERGAAGIYSAEPYGIPRETDSIFLMDYERKPSVHYRDGMWLHNYPEILTSAGFEVIRAEYVDVPWRDEDQRTFVISAKRQ